jgi:glycine betaine/proline transport system ATP-binding protein
MPAAEISGRRCAIDAEENMTTTLGSQRSEQTQRTPAIECRSVWKVFGKRSGETIKAAQNGLQDKDELLKRYGSVVAVSDASFEIYEGETFCIMGLSGSGKSTLIRHFNRLIEPTAGEVIVRGRDVCKLNQTDLREMRSRHMGMVFQHVALLPYRTVLQNVAIPLEVLRVPEKERQASCIAALETVGLGNWVSRYPRELSGGMQQRVGIARALAANPEILLMDEPFSALDPLIRKQLQLEFRQLSTELKKTTVFITHDLEEAIRIGDRIAIMKDGQIVQIGTPEDIVLRPANNYVADFVEGISRLHLVKAYSVMERGTRADGTLPRADLGADLQSLIDLSLKHSAETIAITDGGQPVGFVTREAILRAVGESNSPASVERSSWAGVN